MTGSKQVRRVPDDATEHAGIYAYSDGFDLWLFRCPSCGSTGPKGSGCRGHDAPLAMNTLDEYLVPRVAVKVEFPGETFRDRVCEALEDARDETEALIAKYGDDAGLKTHGDGRLQVLDGLASRLGIDVERKD